MSSRVSFAVLAFLCVSFVIGNVGDPITCEGSANLLLFGLYMSDRPHGIPLQQLCTLHITDDIPFRGLDGVCGAQDPNGRSPIYFGGLGLQEENDPALALHWTISHLMSLRLPLLCRSRCWCSTDPGGDSIKKPKGPVTSDGVVLEERDAIYTIYPGLSPVFERARNRHADSSEALVPRTRLYRFQRNFENKGFAALRAPVPIAMSRFQFITCRAGPIPRGLPFPDSPYSSTDFTRIISLCGHTLAGGNPDANAGGICLDSGDILENEFASVADVEFDENSIPRHDWTEQAESEQSIRAMLHIKHFCWMNCWCARRKNRVRTGTQWQIGGKSGLLLGEDNMMYGSTMKWDGTPIIEPIGEAEDLGNNRVPSSPRHWQSASLRQGLESQARDPNIEIQSPVDRWDLSHLNRGKGDLVADAASALKCGMTCYGPAATACSGKGSNGCNCVVLSSLQARAMGLDSVVLQGLCLFLPLAQPYFANLVRSGSVARSLPGLGLGKRDLEQLDESLNIWKCACNSTYISEKCCGSEDGIIWERAKLSL